MGTERIIFATGDVANLIHLTIGGANERRIILGLVALMLSLEPIQNKTITTL